MCLRRWRSDSVLKSLSGSHEVSVKLSECADDTLMIWFYWKSQDKIATISEIVSTLQTKTINHFDTKRQVFWQTSVTFKNSDTILLSSTPSEYQWPFMIDCWLFLPLNIQKWLLLCTLYSNSCHHIGNIVVLDECFYSFHHCCRAFWSKKRAPFGWLLIMMSYLMDLKSNVVLWNLSMLCLNIGKLPGTRLPARECAVILTRGKF